MSGARRTAPRLALPAGGGHVESHPALHSGAIPQRLPAILERGRATRGLRLRDNPVFAKAEAMVSGEDFAINVGSHPDRDDTSSLLIDESLWES